MRGSAAAARRAAPLPLLSLLAHTIIIVLLGRREAAAQDTAVTDGESAADGASKKLEVAAYFTEFTRQGPYPYQVGAGGEKEGRGSRR